jgi:flagella basal body P-ring formation protein FlgA
MIKPAGHFLSAFLTLALLSIGSEASAQDGRELPRINLRPKSTVVGARIYLSDIVKCSGSDLLCPEVSGIEVSQSPSPGRTTYIQRSYLEQVLEKEWPGAFVTWEGGESTRVEASGVELQTDEIRQKFEDLLGESLRKTSSEVRVVVQRLQPMVAVIVRPAQSKIEFPEVSSWRLQDPDWVVKNLVMNRLLKIRITNPTDPDDKSSFQANVSLLVERYLPVLKHSLTAGQLITESNIKMDWVVMRRGYQDFSLSTHAVVGRKCRQSLASGEPLPPRYLESPIAVTRNQTVTMIVRSGDLAISSRATAVEQAAVGQTIDVVNLVTKKKIKARVIDEKTVEALAF